MLPLTKDDFPLIAVGQNVYRRNGLILFTAPSSELAADLVLRLNRDDTSGFGYKSSGELVYG
jgi:hypothetical protein